MIKVSYYKGRTVNLGNYESERLDIGIELECEDGQEDATLARAREWINRKLQRDNHE